MIEGFPVLETPRLRLRPPREADVASLFAIFRDPETMRYWTTPPMSDALEAEALLHEIERCAEAGTLFQWGIARRENDEAIGTCTLYRIERQHRRAELGYILRRDQWGHGLAHEALIAILSHAFTTLELNRLEADIDSRNARSIRCVERLGFKLEGHQRERYFVGDDIQDSLLYGLLAREWRVR